MKLGRSLFLIGLFIVFHTSIYSQIIKPPSGDSDDDTRVATPPTPAQTQYCGYTKLTAGTPPKGTLYYWQTSSSGTSTANSSTTYNVYANTTVYLKAKLLKGGWSSARAIAVTVKETPQTPIASSKSKCGPGVIALTAGSSTSGASIKWYDGSTYKATGSVYSPNLSASKTYTVKAYKNGCYSSSTTVTATVKAVPATPVANDKSKCGSGTIALTATCSTKGASIQWYDGSTYKASGSSYSPSLSSTKIFTVKSYKDGCYSSSDDVTATIKTVPATPSASSKSRCGKGTVSLAASTSTSGASIKWYDGSSYISTGSSYTPNLLTTKTYNVKAYKDGCYSSSRNVTATIKTIPALPKATNESRCGTGAVTLKASSSTSGASLKWYDGVTYKATTGSFTTPSLSSSKTYNVKSYLNGCYSSAVNVDAEVITIPAVPSASSVSRCGGGTVTLSASTTTSGASLKWYDGSTYKATGSNYSPSVSSTKTYNVRSYKNGCESSSRNVTATVKTIPAKPVANDKSICGNGTVTLTATTSTSGASLKWYQGKTYKATGSSYAPSVTQTTTYNVKSYLNGCYSTEDYVNAVVKTIPSVPSASSVSRCGGGTVTLSASTSTSGASLKWYDGSTYKATGSNYSPSVSSTKTYNVRSYKDGCESSSRNVTATVKTIPAKPVANDKSICGSGTVTLTATTSTSGASLKWYQSKTYKATGSSYAPSVTQTTTYNVKSYLNGCYSTEDYVNAVVKTIPSVPSASSVSRCGSGIVTLTASTKTAGASIKWYDGSTLKETATSYSPSLSATKTYNVKSYLNGCYSSKRDVTATIKEIPTAPPGDSKDRCGAGTVTLQTNHFDPAVSIKWYDGSTLKHTGASYTTPSLSSSKTYTIKSYKNGCYSIVNSSGVATVKSIPAIPSASGKERCGTGPVSLTASTSTAGASIKWYDGNTFKHTGTSYTTPSLLVTKTYNAKTYKDGCYSANKPVTATIQTKPSPVVTTTTPEIIKGVDVTLSTITGLETITAWESKAPAGDWISVASNEVSKLFTPSATGEWNYRVKVEEGVCKDIYSNSKSVIVHDPFINSSTGSLSYAYNAESKSILVISNVDWEIESFPGWIESVSPLSGRANTSVTLNVTSKENFTINSNSGSILITGRSSNKQVILETLSVSQEAGPERVSISIESGPYSYHAGTFNLVVESNTTWSLNSNDAWFPFPMDSYFGNRTITLNYPLNPTTLRKQAEFAIYLPGTTKTAMFVQEGGPDITFVEAQIELPNSGNKIFDVFSSLDAQITSKPDWLIVESVYNDQLNNGKIYTLKGATHNSAYPRQDLVTFRAEDGDYVIEKTIDVFQAGAEPFLYLPNATEITFGENDPTTQTVEILTNVNWDATTSNDFFSIENRTGSGSGSFNVKLTNNRAAEGFITLRAVDIGLEPIIIPAKVPTILEVTCDAEGQGGITNPHEIPWNGGNIKLTINTNDDWNITTNVPWIVLGTISGSQNTVLFPDIMHCLNQEDDRNGFIRIQAGDLSHKVYFNQTNGIFAVDLYNNSSVELVNESSNLYSLPPHSQTLEFSINSNIEYYVLNSGGDILGSVRKDDTTNLVSKLYCVINNNKEVTSKSGKIQFKAEGILFDEIQFIQDPVQNYLNNSNDKNWVQTTTYSDNGRITGQSVTFSDKLGKAVQSVSRNFSNDKVIISQPVYDEYGRPKITTLPAPVNQQEMTFNEEFINETNLTDPDIFELDPSTEHLAYYYSNYNTEEPYVPADAMPYAEVEYSTHIPGAITKSYMVGEHASEKYSTGFTVNASPDELMEHPLALAGVHPLNLKPISENNPLAKNDFIGMTKSVSRDVMGKESIVYVNVSGNVVASCISGDSPACQITAIYKIKARSYIDIHIPNNSDGLLNCRNDVLFTITNLVSESQESVTLYDYHIEPGFYRIHNHSYYDTNIEQTIGYKYYAFTAYDETGRVVRTLAPKDVEELISGESNVSNLDNIVSRNTYNSLGEVVNSYSQDEGLTYYMYRKDGSIRFSQNTKQLAEGKASYTNYDKHGRIVEVGEIHDNSTIFNGNDIQNTPFFSNILENNYKAGNFNESEVIDGRISLVNQTYTTYDFPAADAPKSQEFVRGKVSKSWNSNTSTWYSYNFEGLVTHVYQSYHDFDFDNDGIPGELEHDLVTIKYFYNFEGQVIRVTYSVGEKSEIAHNPDIPLAPGQPNIDEYYHEFTHFYEYDLDGRLEKVYTQDYKREKTLQARYYYYQHGPLKRVELAENLQGIDYVYNIHGWLKSINNPNTENNDPGQDGISGQNNNFGMDAFAMGLSYFSNDYLREHVEINSAPSYNFDGNIAYQHWKTNTHEGDMSEHMAWKYTYDERNYLGQAATGRWDSEMISGLATENFLESVNREYAVYGNIGGHSLNNITYDANGNILELHRNMEGGIVMDRLIYNYPTGKNALNSIDDMAGSKITGVDYPGSVDGDYAYNEIGQLTQNWVDNHFFTYDVYDKTHQIFKDEAHTIELATYEYNEAGFRIKKYDAQMGETTWYIRDANGNILTTYTQTETDNEIQRSEVPLYGSGRIGVLRPNSDGNYQYIYELTDHLGNVRATIGKDNQLLSSIDYYPFGMEMPGRKFYAIDDYTFGYQGQFAEKDQETCYNQFEARLYDSRIGRWLITDPAGQYHSPYLAMGNNWINGVDPDGEWVKGAGFWNNVFHSDSRIHAENYAAAANMQDLSTTYRAERYDGRLWGVASAEKGFSVMDGAYSSKFFGFTPVDMDGNLGATSGFSMITPNIASGACTPLYLGKYLLPLPPVVSGVKWGLGAFGNIGTRVLGTAQATGTRGHALLSKAIGLRYSLDPRVARVTYDLGYKRLLGGGSFKYGPRPDVGVLFKSGRVKVFEIGSKTDNLLQLSNRNLNFMRQNGINGSVRVYSGARYFNALWPK